MRAIRFENAGNADVIKLAEEPIPQLRPHDLLVRVRAAGLNRADILQRQGFYGERPDFGDSVIPGLEIAGEVVDAGTAAAGFRNGDRVMPSLAAERMRSMPVWTRVWPWRFPAGSPLPAPRRSPKSLSRRTKL
jgi:NADPH:quinone reductase-like Zn-dependent oxidoreductase